MCKDGQIFAKIRGGLICNDLQSFENVCKDSQNVCSFTDSSSSSSSDEAASKPHHIINPQQFSDPSSSSSNENDPPNSSTTKIEDNTSDKEKNDYFANFNLTNLGNIKKNDIER